MIFKGLGCEGYRLPTEAEWEYAARAGTETPFWTGENLTSEQANYGGAKPVPVRSFAANPWGLYEVHGNIWEWVHDGYESYAEEAIEDPIGPERASDRVVRGGSWSSGPQDARVANRFRLEPTGRYVILGFRVARSAP